MAAPSWITRAGSLGIAVQLEPFSVDLKVQTGIYRATFKVISGQLPPGLSLSERGNITGYPIGKLGGIPLAVNEDTTFTFVVRCTNEINQVADRTFDITVTGEIPPEPKLFTQTVDGYQDLGTVSDGTWIEIDLTGYDVNPGDVLSYQVVSGSLPLGLSVSNLGKLTGYIEPSQFTLETYGFDVTPWDEGGFDFQLDTEGQPYYFDLEISDGKIPVIVPYKLFAQRLNVNKHVPVLLNRNTSLGTYVDENHFFYQFQSRDFDGDLVGYEIVPIIRVPTVISGEYNSVVTVGSIFSINQSLGFSTIGTTATVYDILDEFNQPKVYSDTSTLLAKVDGVWLQVGIDFEVKANTLRILGGYDVNNKLIELYEGIIFVTGDGPTVSMSQLATLINNASLVDLNIKNVVADFQNGHLVIYTTDDTLDLADIDGVALQTELGIDPASYTRNTDDVDEAVTINPSQPIPSGLEIDPNTGWLYGYINAINTGSETYNFYVRVFKRITEASSVTIPIDYVTYYPFSVLNGRSQAELDELGLDVGGKNFEGRTVVFAQQENYESSYTGLAGTVFSSDPASLSPAAADLGWAVDRYLVFSELGTSRVSRTVQATTTGTTFTLDSVEGIKLGMKVTGTGITGTDEVDSIDVANKTVTLFISHTISEGTTLNFDQFKYVLPEFYDPDDLVVDLGNTVANIPSDCSFNVPIFPATTTNRFEFSGTPAVSDGKKIKVFDVKAGGYVVPGWTESQVESTIYNRRGGIWKFQKRDVDNRYYLVFVKEIQQGQVVVADRLIYDLATDGSVRRHKKLVYEIGDNFAPPQTVPSFNTERFLVYSGTGTVSSTYALPVYCNSETVARVTIDEVVTTNYTLVDNTLVFNVGVDVDGKIIKVYGSVNNPYSKLWHYEMIVNSNNNYLLSWNTSQDLGTIVSGTPSRIAISASNAAGGVINYSVIPYNTQTVNGTFVNSDLIVLDNVSELVTGMKVRSDTVQLVNDPIILEIIPGKNQIKLSSQQTLDNNTILKFLGTDIPRGMSLNANGELQGRPSHQHWYLRDNTTFDNSSTTFDRTYTLNIKASTYINDPYLREINIVRTFKLTVEDFKTVPSTNLYLEFLLRPEHRKLLHDAIYNDQLVPDEHLFRGSDAWWGRQDRYQMLVAYGIETAQAAVVQSAVAAYHHKRHYRFPKLSWAQALDSKGNVEYEVIYMNPVGEFTTSAGSKLVGDIRTTRTYTDLYETTLSQNLNVLAQQGSVTGISLTQSTRLDAGMLLVVDKEQMMVNSIDPITGEITVVRGYNNTVVSTYASGTTVKVYLPSVLQLSSDNTDITVDSDLLEASSDYIRYLKPGSLPNMQARLREILGNNNRQFLPTWMTTKQPDNRILNYTLAVPLVYVKPGKGKLMLYKLQEAVNTAINTGIIEGLSDRYYWDDGLAVNWDKSQNKFYDDLYTTFDRIVTSETFNFLTNVDLAVTARFNQIDGARVSDLRGSGLLDGYRGPIVGLRIVFYQQEQYSDNQYDFYEYEGWARILSRWETNFESEPFEGYEIITGYNELASLPASAWSGATSYVAGDYAQYNGITYRCVRSHAATGAFKVDYWVRLTSDSVNQRAGIWLITEDSNGLVKLVFDQEVSYTGDLPWDSVAVNKGVAHGGTVISLVSPLKIDPTYTVPGWLDRSTLAISSNQTVFDADTTQFFDRNTDEFIKPDDGAKYIVFKNQSFIDRGTVDV